MTPLEGKSDALLGEPLLTAAQVGKLLGGIPSKTVLQYARDGRLPCLHIGKHVRFLRQDIERAIDRQRQAIGLAPAAASPRRPPSRQAQQTLFSRPAPPAQ